MNIRVTDNAQFGSIVDNLFSIRKQYQDVMEKMSSQKNINKISDDPLGVTRIISFKQTNQAIDQYKTNVENTSSWLSITEGKLNNANDILTQATELAVSQSSATANAQTRKIAAQKVQAIKDQMLSLANSKLGDRYLFSGSRDDVAPFTVDEGSAKIDPPEAGGANTYGGTVVQSGTYTGGTNKTYVLKITTAGDQTAAKFKISSDGGKTWGAESAAGAIDAPNLVIGDGIELTFPDGVFAVNDLFHVNAYAAGYYQGNGGELDVAVNKDSSTNYNITGEEAFTDKGDGSIDIFKALKSLKDALEGNDVDGISTAINDMKEAQKQISICTAKCGSRANRMDMAKSNLSELELNMTALISATEDADLAELSTKFYTKQVALQAAYEVASRISSNSIINFLK